MIHSRGVAVILAFALCGCNARDKRDDVAAKAQPVIHVKGPTGPQLVTLPPQKLDTVHIEGAVKQLTMRLVQPESSLPFYTYVPEDMIPADSTSGEGERHYFIANFAGKRNDQAYLMLQVFPAGMPKENVMAIAKAYRSAHQEKDFVNTFDLRMHNDRYYFITEHYPREYADGMAPRIGRILNEWQWLDVTSAPRP